MPTVHVTPESALLLQDIANSLYKAKKVVVVTGAGISTNSGIPVSRRVSQGILAPGVGPLLIIKSGLPI